MVKMAFNRTIMELKRIKPAAHPAAPGSFNRTIMELKRCKSGDSSMKYHPFNRTIMELKHVWAMPYALVPSFF